jgi:hypothetical protein
MKYNSTKLSTVLKMNGWDGNIETSLMILLRWLVLEG